MESSIQQQNLSPKSKYPDFEDSASRSVIYNLIFIPLELSLGLASAGFRALRPLASPAIPLLVFALFIPVAAVFSLFAGWSVWRNAAGRFKSSLDLQYGDGLPPYAEVVLPNLVAQQLYDIALELLIPATEANFALGNFMAGLTLSSTSNKTLVSIRRPAIATPPSPRLLSRTPTLLNLNIPLLVAYVPGFSKIKARVELGRRDGWQSLGGGQGRELAVTQAALCGVVHHQGIRGLTTRFPLITAAVCASIFFGITLLVLAACVLPTIQLGKAIEWPSAEVEAKAESEDAPLPPARPELLSHDSDTGFSEEDRSRRRRRRASRPSGESVRRRKPRVIKTEEDTIPIPAADSGSRPLGRRRSYPSFSLNF